MEKLINLIQIERRAREVRGRGEGGARGIDTYLFHNDDVFFVGNLVSHLLFITYGLIIWREAEEVAFPCEQNFKFRNFEYLTIVIGVS